MENNKGRVQTILNMDPEIFMIYLKNLSLEDILLFKENQEMYGVKGNLSETSVLRNNCIQNLLNNKKYSDISDFNLKLIELALTFPDDDFFGTLAYYDDALSDEIIASTYNTSVSNVQMKKMYDKKALELIQGEKTIKK